MAVWIAAVGLLAIAALGLIYALSGGPPDGTGTPDLETERGTAQMSTRALGALIGTMNAGETRTLTPGETGAAVIPTTPAAATDTASPAPTATRTPTVTAVPSDTPTATPTRTPSRTPRPTRTPTVTQTASRTPTNTRTPTPSDTPDLEATTDHLLALRLTATAEARTDTPTPTLTRTPDLEATADYLVAQRLTATANAWTDTPTPDVPATILAWLTQTALAWTDTPTPSRTPSPPPTPTPFGMFIPTPTPRAAASACLLPVRVQANSGARTTLLPDSPTRIRSGPGLNSSAVLHSNPPGQTFWIARGPDGVDGINWWQVRAYDAAGLWTGWIAEGAPGQYWIEPFATGSFECVGALPPRLTPGEQGRITLFPALPSNVRTGPSRASSRLDRQLAPGQTLTVISGPVCDPIEPWRWWLVRTGTTQGWVAEGEPGEYWVEPWP
jgi:hypothetical protein